MSDRDVAGRHQAMRVLRPDERASAIDGGANVIGFDRFLDRQRRIERERDYRRAQTKGPA